MRRVLAGAALLGVVFLFALLPAAALALQGAEAITTTIRYDDPETGEKVTAVGVTITVTTEDGEVVGTAATDGEGVFPVHWEQDRAGGVGG